MTRRECGSLHPQCHVCWLRLTGLSPDPAQIEHPTAQLCCFCGRPTTLGIFVSSRSDSPDLTHCPDRQLDLTPGSSDAACSAT